MYIWFRLKWAKVITSQRECTQVLVKTQTVNMDRTKEVTIISVKGNMCKKVKIIKEDNTENLSIWTFFWH